MASESPHDDGVNAALESMGYIFPVPTPWSTRY